jgi:hypothetical protein
MVMKYGNMLIFSQLKYGNEVYSFLDQSFYFSDMICIL